MNGTCTYKGSETNQWGRIDKVSDVNGYTEANFGTGSRPADFDTDKDGMPDAWETANGLDPAKDDSKLYTIDSQEMYTNIEVYCNSLVQPIMLAGNSDAIEGLAVRDYYPAYYNEQQELVNAINSPIADAIVLPSASSSVPFSFCCNMQGQRVSANYHGLVIREGRKYISK